MKNNKWYSLPAIPTLLIVAAAAVSLTATLTGDLGPVLTYFSYFFSTYALIAGIFGLIRFFPWMGQIIRNTKIMQKLHSSDHAARYLDDPIFRTKINLYFGTAINALYIFIKFFSGVALRSGWLIAFALYYTVLTALRVSLVTYVRQSEIRKDICAEFRRYRFVGMLLLSMNLVLSVIISRMIAQNEAYSYPGALIYAMAAYTFYAVILSVTGLVRFRRHGSPVLSAVKVVNLTAAMVALLSLEATMLQRFSDADSGIFQGKMIGISGLVVSLILLSISIYMIIHASGKLSLLEEKDYE